MYYLKFDNDGYLLGYTSILPDGANPSEWVVTEDEVNIDLEDVYRLRSYYLRDGHLVLDEKHAIELKRADEEAVSQSTIEQEVQLAIIHAQINTLAVDDTTALRWKSMYPTWSPDNVHYTAKTDEKPAMKVQWKDELYYCQQTHDSQAGWAPDVALSLWVKIDEGHSGTFNDPIPYSGNMVLENGKYYVQNGTVYRCIRDTINPVYHDLKDLIGLYVEKV